jgi:hypothetical protein
MRIGSQGSHRLVRLTLTAFAGLTALAVAAPAGASTPSATSGRVAAAARIRIGEAARLPAGAVRAGVVPAGERIRADVVLQPRDAAGLRAYASAVSNPRGPLYRHYLSPASIAAQFGPAPSAVAAVEASLRAGGLVPGTPRDHGLIVPFTGTAATVEKAFDTTLVAVRLAGGGTGRMATSAPSVSSAVAPDVAAVIGLDDVTQTKTLGSLAVRRPGTSSAAAAVGGLSGTSTSSAPGPHACAAATKFAQLVTGYTEDQIARAYGTNSLYRANNLGDGQTVDIFELEPFAMTDVAAFDRCFFGISHTNLVNVVPIDGGAGTGFGSGEAALDTEEVSALAPAAQIDVYEAPGTLTSWIDEEAAIVAADNASIVSESYGLCESYLAQIDPGFMQIENVLFEQAALEGQSWFISSGDGGSEACSFSLGDPTQTELAVSDPGSQDFITSVGGTSMLAPTNPPTEVVWNDGGIADVTFDGGSTGGISDFGQMPSWQSGLGIPGVDNSYSSGTPCAAASGVLCREVPDVSGSADQFHGDTIFYGRGWTAFGGTSVAAPKWAAIGALTNQLCSTEGVGPIGFADPALYTVAGSSYAQAFNDVTLGNNDVLGANAGAYPATANFDMATGLGTPRVTGPKGAPGLASLLCHDGSSLASRPVLSGVSVTGSPGQDWGPAAGGTNVTITGTNLTGVTSVSFGSTSVAVSSSQINVGGTQISNVVTPASPLNPGAPGGPVGGVLVTAAGPGGASLPSPAAEFHFVAESSNSPVPSVSYVGPSAGKSTGGESVLIIGSGFDEALGGASTPTVEFGGTPATSVTMLSDSELSVVVPAEVDTTDCATASATPPVSTSTICQVEVTVSNQNGSSATAPILPAAYGPTNQAPPPNTELVAAPTEFDYAPPPTTTSISPTSLPEQVNFFGGAPPVVTIDGTGFDFLTFQQVTFGAVGAPYSVPDNFVLLFEPDELQLYYFGLQQPVDITQMPVTVQTAGGTSDPPLTVDIPAAPTLDSLSVHAGPTTGGTVVDATGSGFAPGDMAEFVSLSGPFFFPVTATTNVTVDSPTQLSFVTPAETPASVGAFVICTTGACSVPDGPGSGFTYFQPVQPVVASISPTRSPAGGGGTATILGTGLGSVQSVFFGSVRSPEVLNPPGLTGGSDTVIEAVIPPGTAGSTVSVTVQTLAGAAHVPGKFTYFASAPSAPGAVLVEAGGGLAKVLWARSASDGGAPLLGYVVTATPKNGGAVRSVRVGPSVLHAVLSPLLAGTAYRIAVSAVNSIGRSTTVGPVVKPSLGDDGYLVASTQGAVAGFGDLGAAPSGLAGSPPPAAVVAMTASPGGKGYWLADAGGGVHAFGNAPDLGSLHGVHLHSPIVGMAALPDGEGYWLVGADGGVFSFGKAGFHGSLGGVHLAGPIVAILAAPDGGGYWLVGADGGVFGFGTAKFRGSLGGEKVGTVVAGMAAPTGLGYWLVAANGGVFTFGSAKYHGSLGGAAPSPIVAATLAPDGNGYWLLDDKGGVHALGSAVDEGDAVTFGRVAAIAV